MLLPHGLIIALVDGKHFRLLKNQGTEAHPELTEVPVPTLDTHNHSGGHHRSSAGNHADSLVSEDAHAIAVVEWLNSQVLGHKLAQLVIIASPRTLGEMRRQYHGQLRQALLAEVSKDLVTKSGPEIVAALRAG